MKAFTYDRATSAVEAAKAAQRLARSSSLGGPTCSIS